MPVIGLEAEFRVFVDETEVVPEEYWKTPSGFIDRPLLRRSTKSSQLPTGGAVYFDGGVLEVVTPVIEIAPQCTARVVRSLWEQITFVREQLDRWGKREGKGVRLGAFSCHFNISFEIPREDRNRNRTIQKLALLLMHLLPVPVILLGANKESTGMGVRPRRDRIELTLDFTPDPGLMAATTALIVGVVRDVIRWPSYRVEEIAAHGIPMLHGLTPAKHATRNGWLTRAAHFPRDPFNTGPNVRVWVTEDGRTVTMRELALEIAQFFAPSIREVSDAFSQRILFSVLEGKTPALLDLPSRPAAYDDVGHQIRWGDVLPELQNFAAVMEAGSETPRRRRRDVEDQLEPPWSGNSERRRRVTLPAREERRTAPRRTTSGGTAPPRLDRSRYERVFRQLSSGKSLHLGKETLTPVAVRGWYHAIFLDDHGEERLLSIDQVLDHMDRWRS